MAQRAGGDAGPLAVETAVLRDQPILQETSQAPVRPVAQATVFTEIKVCLAKTGAELEKMFPIDANEGNGQDTERQFHQRGFLR